MVETEESVSLQLPLNCIFSENVDSASRKAVDGFANSLSKVLPSKADGVSLYFEVNPNLEPEAYTLKSSKTGIRVSASSKRGFYYAMETFKRLLGAEAMAGIRSFTTDISVVEIEDSPRFPMRVFMLDVSRHFFNAEEIKKILKLMAAYKMNTFQWHLTDDQGWRLPVENYPLLTTVGAVHPANTAVTDFSRQTLQRSKVPAGPYAYTPEEIHDVVAYADSLNITVIPEVEMPGHMAAAIAAYPYLSCWPDSVHSVRDLHGISEDVLDVSSPRAMRFVYDVIDCLADYFPGEYIHIGGDESPTKAWQDSEGCKKMVKKLKFKGANEEQRYRKLQNWFTSRVNEYASKKGKKLVVWDEIVTAPGADIEVAKQIKPLVTAYDIVCDQPVKQTADAGLDCVYSPFGPYYINRRYSDCKIGAGNGRDDPEAVFNHQVPESGNVKGLQATFWTEWVCRLCDLEYLALPRLAIIAEKGWTNSESGDYADFCKKFDEEHAWLDAAGYRYRTEN